MITYSYERNFDAAQAQSLFLSVGWESGSCRSALYAALMHSETVLTAATETLPLAGLMSAVSDGGMNVYFPYLLVHPDARHHEIGRTLVRLMLVRYRDCRRKILVCPDSRVSFYKAAGWKTARDQTAMLLSSLPEHGFTAEETAFTVEP